MTNKKSSVIYAGTIIGVGLFIILMYTLNASLTQILYTVIGVGMFVSFIVIADKILPKAWFLGITLCIGIVIFYLYSQAWIMTVILAIFALVYLYIYIGNGRKSWGPGVLFGMMVVASLGILFMFDDHKLPTINKDALQSAMKEMNEHSEVLNASIGVEDETIYCSLNVEKKTTKAEKEQLGETCAKTLAANVSEDTKLKGPSGDYLGEIYDYYVLEITIGTDNEGDEIIFARKHTNNEGFNW